MALDDFAEVIEVVGGGVVQWWSGGVVEWRPLDASVLHAVQAVSGYERKKPGFSSETGASSKELAATYSPLPAPSGW